MRLRGPATAFATVAALRYRAQTGRGQLVEVDQSENILNHLGDIFIDCQLGVEPRRWGNRDRWQAPQGLYRCRGEAEWLAISVTDDAAWRALAEAMGRGDLGRDPRLLIWPGGRTTTTSWTAHWCVGGRANGAKRLSRTPTGRSRRRPDPRGRVLRGRSAFQGAGMAATTPQPRRGHPPSSWAAVPRCPTGVAPWFAGSR